MDCSLLGSSVHGIFQARVLEWIAISFSRGFSQPRNWTQVSSIAGRRLTVWATREALSPLRGGYKYLEAMFKPWKWKWSRSVVSDHMDYSLSGSSVHGIFQARVLEWIAISFSRGSSRPRNRTQVSSIAGRRFTIWATREAQRVLNNDYILLLNPLKLSHFHEFISVFVFF